jgi:hypothetical protein
LILYVAENLLDLKSIWMKTSTYPGRVSWCGSCLPTSEIQPNWEEVNAMEVTASRISKILSRGSMLVVAVLAIVAITLNVYKPNQTVKAAGTSLVQSLNSIPGCTPQDSFGAQCFVTFTWPTAFVDSNYAVTCTPGSVDFSGFNVSSLGGYDITVFEKTPTQATLVMRQLQPTAVTLNHADCIAAHN